MQKVSLFKLYSLLVVAVISISVSGCSQVKWVEGTHYKTIDSSISQNSSGQKNVKEYFSFWCPHCYQAEPFMKQLSSELPKDIAFIKVHVNFMGFVSEDSQNIGTLSLMAARANQTETQFTDAIFKAIHVDNSTLEEIDDFARIWSPSSDEEQSLANFVSATTTASVQSMATVNNQMVDGARQYISGVPSLVVNDKYVLILSSDLSLEEIKELIIWLSAK